jgi:hypothetical protein
MGRDLRRYTRKTYFNLLVGFVILLLVGGGGLVYLLYGPGAATSAVVCMLIGLAPIVLVGMALLIIQWIAARRD